MDLGKLPVVPCLSESGCENNVEEDSLSFVCFVVDVRSPLLLVIGILIFLGLSFRQNLGCFKGLKVRNPAPKVWTPSLLDFNWKEEELPVDNTEHSGSPLLFNRTVQFLIPFAFSPTEEGSGARNRPFSSVFASLEIPFGHSTITEAPALK